MVLYNLRMVYTREATASSKRSFSAMEDQHQEPDQPDEASLQLKSEDAVLDVDMSTSRTRKNSHAGWGFVTVANRQVAELLVKASLNDSLNCAPPTRSLLKRERHKNVTVTFSNIRRNPRDIDLSKVPLPACGFGVVEVLHSSAAGDSEEPRQDPAATSSARRKQHKFFVLWETAVTDVCSYFTSVHICPLVTNPNHSQRCLELLLCPRASTLNALSL